MSQKWYVEYQPIRMFQYDTSGVLANNQHQLGHKNASYIVYQKSFDIHVLYNNFEEKLAVTFAFFFSLFVSIQFPILIPTSCRNALRYACQHSLYMCMCKCNDHCYWMNSSPDLNTIFNSNTLVIVLIQFVLIG